MIFIHYSNKVLIGQPILSVRLDEIELTLSLNHLIVKPDPKEKSFSSIILTLDDLVIDAVLISIKLLTGEISLVSRLVDEGFGNLSKIDGI